MPTDQEQLDQWIANNLPGAPARSADTDTPNLPLTHEQYKALGAIETSRAIAPVMADLQAVTGEAPAKGSMEALRQYTSTELGPSKGAIDVLDRYITQALPLAPASTEVPPPPRAEAAQKAAPDLKPSNVGLVNTVGSEFGEVDRPSRGGYTEAGWDRGAWGDSLTGKDNEGVALPPDVLNAYGYGQKGFQKDFNDKYEVQVVSPTTGKVVTANLKDIGPGKSTGAGLDMLWKTRENLGLEQNFKGPVQYRIVPKGSAAPEGSTLVSTGGGAQTTGTTGTTQASGPAPVYIQPINPRLLKTPDGTGNMDTSDLALYARDQTNQYATELAKNGTPMNVEEYKKEFGNFYAGAVKANAGVPRKEMPQQDVDTLTSIVTGLHNLDKIQDLHKKAWEATGKSGWALDPTQSGPLSAATRKDEVKNFDTGVLAISGPLARGVFGQTGVLTEPDVQHVKDALPNGFDSPAQGAQKIQILREQSLDNLRQKLKYFRAAHYDTAGLEQEYGQLVQEYQAHMQHNDDGNPQLSSEQKSVKRQAQADAVDNHMRKTPPPPTPSPTPNQPQQLIKPPILGMFGQ
jgi:hypothetical protein